MCNSNLDCSNRRFMHFLSQMFVKAMASLRFSIITQRPPGQRVKDNFHTAMLCLHGLVQEERFSNVFYFGNCALEIESLGQDDLEDLVRVSDDTFHRLHVGEIFTFCTLIL